MVFYESQKLNENENNCLTHDLVLAAILHALKMGRHYLLIWKFVLMSDHIRFRYLFDQLNMNPREARWLAMISEFDFEIRYIKGKSLGNYELLWGGLIGYDLTGRSIGCRVYGYYA